MRTRIGILTIILVFVIATAVHVGQQPSPTGATPPAWAYPVNPPAAAGNRGAQPAQPAAPPNTAPRTLPGSSASFTQAQTRDLFNVADWHPDNHPPAPEIVLKGRRPDVRACGYCHLPNGQGRPENSSLAGLPASYIIQQMADFKNGLRKSSEARMGPPAAMVTLAKAASDEDNAAAAAYFASFKFKQWIRVVESNTVPKHRIQGGMFVPAEESGTEPIGQRIIEMPENLERTELRDSGSGFVAYVPTGSIKKGEALVKTGGAGKTVQCGLCHGNDLKGLGPVPGIAGRSPSYTVRQLFDMQQGNRAGQWSELMKAAVAKLTQDDLIAIAAYTASLAP